MSSWKGLAAEFVGVGIAVDLIESNMDCCSSDDVDIVAVDLVVESCQGGVGNAHLRVGIAVVGNSRIGGASIVGQTKCSLIEEQAESLQRKWES